MKEEKKSRKLKINTKQIKRFLPWVILLVIGLIICVNIFNQVKDLESIPTCLYGCDYYWQNGILLDLINNPNYTWQSSTHDYMEGVNSVPKSYAYARLAIIKIFGLSYYESWKSVFALSYLFVFVGLVGWFLFYRRIFHHQYLGLFLSLLTMNLGRLPYFKYFDLVIPTLPYFFLLILELRNKSQTFKKDIGYALLIIPLIVFLSNLHAMVFFIIYFAIFFAWCFFVLGHIKPKLIWESLKDKLVRRKTLIFSLVFLVSFVLNLLLGWWYKAIFIFAGDKNSFRFDIHPDFNFTNVFLSKTIQYIKAIFFDYSSILIALVTVLFILGLVLYLYLKARSKIDKNNVILWAIVLFFFSIFHYFITVPLFHQFLSPGHALLFLLPFFKALMVGILFIILLKIKNLKIKKFHLTLISVLLLVIFLIGSMVSLNSSLKNNQFWQNGKKAIPSYYQDLAFWIKENELNPSDMVILSTNELSFALNGILGTKHVVGRQSHFFHFGDFQDYWMESALILYGNNSKLRKDLLQKYLDLSEGSGKKLYLYWDYYWINSEWQISGQQVYPFDPLRFEYNQKREELLERNGINFTIKEKAVFEPSAQANPLVTRLDIIYLTPSNYHNETNPWQPELNNYLEKVWDYKQNGQIMASLFEVKI